MADVFWTPATPVVAPSDFARASVAARLAGAAADGSLDVFAQIPAGSLAEVLNLTPLAAADGATQIGTTEGKLQDVLNTLAPRQPVARYTDVTAGEAMAWRGLLSNFWDPYQNSNPVGRPRIRPIGGTSATWGLTNLATDPSTPIPEPSDHIGALWMMEEFFNGIADRARRGDAYAKQIVALQAEHVLLSLGNGDRAMGLSLMADGTTEINAEDDGSWKASFLLEWFEITGSQDAINALEGVIPGVLTRFADTTVARVDAGSGLLYSPLGLQYDTAGDGGAGQSSLYEVPLAVAALRVHDITGLPGYLAYPQAISDLLDTSFKVRAPGKAPILARGLVLDSSLYGGAPRGAPINGDYGPEQTALDVGFAKPQRFGRANTLLLGMMSAVVLNARLWLKLGTAKYLSRALSLIDAMGQPDTAGGMIITQDVTVPGTYAPDDTWTGGHWAQRFAAEGLTLPGADPTSAVRAAIVKTAQTILVGANSGFLTADWCGARLAPATDGLLNGFTTFQARWDANPSGGVEAGRRQIMTSGTAFSMVQAGATITSWAPAGIGVPATTNGFLVKRAAVELGYRATIDDAFTLLRSADPYALAVDQWDQNAQIAANDDAYQAIATAVGSDAAAAIMAKAATL